MSNPGFDFALLAPVTEELPPVPCEKLRSTMFPPKAFGPASPSVSPTNSAPVRSPDDGVNAPVTGEPVPARTTTLEPLSDTAEPATDKAARSAHSPVAATNHDLLIAIPPLFRMNAPQESP